MLQRCFRQDLEGRSEAAAIFFSHSKCFASMAIGNTASHACFCSSAGHLVGTGSSQSHGNSRLCQTSSFNSADSWALFTVSYVIKDTILYHKIPTSSESEIGRDQVPPMLTGSPLSLLSLTSCLSSLLDVLPY